MKKTIIVKNLITEEKETYFNDKGARYNLITSILSVKKINIFYTKERQKIEEEEEIDLVIHKGKKAYHCYKYDLFSYIQN